MIDCIIVGIGGFIGSSLRYLFSKIPIKENFTLPINTLLINIIGSFIIGIIVTVAFRNTNLNPKVTLLIKTGFCGGFTTFSTFALESYDLINNGKWNVALVYMCLSIIFSILAIICAKLVIDKVLS